MRIEFMAPEEFKREHDFRVDVQEGVHARSCTGEGIALVESDVHPLMGRLPNGGLFTGNVRVTRPSALVMLKLLALFGRYNNIRGAPEAYHDREEAQTHAADVVAIVAAQPDPAAFKRKCEEQFKAKPVLGIRVLRILNTFFGDATSPGVLVFEEYLAANALPGHGTREERRRETERGHRIVCQILPSPEFFALAAAVEDSSDLARNSGLVEEYLSALEQTRTPVWAQSALSQLPGTAFGSAFKRGDRFHTDAFDALQKITTAELNLLHAWLQVFAAAFRQRGELKARYPHALSEGVTD